MKKLEKVLKEVSVKNPELKESIPYEGLQLIEDKSYTGGTSIKYWM